jgi:hypothetical protein
MKIKKFEISIFCSILGITGDDSFMCGVINSLNIEGWIFILGTEFHSVF